MVKLGIIGGSGAKGVIAALASDTPLESDDLTVDRNNYTVDFFHFRKGEAEIYFVLRHGKDHTDLPQKLDQRGIVRFLEKRKLQGVVLTSATGSLDTSIQLVDEGGIVVNSGVFRGFGYHSLSLNDPHNPHAVLADPYDTQLRRLLLDSIGAVSGATAYDGGLYVQNEGNSFESPAEIASLYLQLHTPAIGLENVAIMRAAFERAGITASSGSRDRSLVKTLNEQEEMYRQLDTVLNVRYAQVSMNAVRETVLLREAGVPVALASFPVNYGAGLVSQEQVDHERTKTAIARATQPYIVPFLVNVIERAPHMLGR